MIGYGPKRFLYLVSAAIGVVVVSGALACLYELFTSGAVVFRIDNGPATSLTGLKAFGLSAALLFAGAGIFWSSLYQLRRAGRHYDSMR